MGSSIPNPSLPIQERASSGKRGLRYASAMNVSRRILGSVLACLLTAPACETFTDVVIPLTGQFVAIAVVPPVGDGEEIPLSSQPWVYAHLSKAQEEDQISEFPIDDGTVRLVVEGAGSLDLLATGSDGEYLAVNGEGDWADFASRAAYTFQATGNGRSGSAVMEMPDPPQYSLRSTIPPLTDLVVDINNGPYDAVAMTVLGSLGDVVWSQHLDSAGAVLEAVSGEEVTQVVLPAAAFPEPATLYLVGIAGLQVAGEEAFEGINAPISHLLVGAMRFEGVTTE